MRKIDPKLIVAVVAILSLVGGYVYYTKQKKDLSDWRTNPPVVDIVISNGSGESAGELEATNSVDPSKIVHSEAVVAESGNSAATPQKATVPNLDFTVQGSSLVDLSSKMKEKSAQILAKNPNYFPSACKVNLNNFEFTCVFENHSKKENLIKVGLYFGPKNVGCESCQSVLQNNPNSIVLLNASNSAVSAQVIGIK
jgi:hypothetical protein